MHASAQSRRALRTAMFCAAGVTAQLIAGKATRDALYLTNLDVTSLPTMVIVTAAVSIGLVVLMSKGLRHVSPGAFVSMVFAANAVLFLADWLLVPSAPRAAAVLVYLQISGVVPLLGSGFWLIATERFDPHSASKRFGQIAGAGTLGGLVGGLMAERVGSAFGVAATLPLLAVGNLYCAWLIRQLDASGRQGLSSQIGDVAPDLAPEAPRSGLRVLREASYLQNLALLVLLSTCGAALVDYLFKAQAVVVFGRGESLLRFFAIFYAAIGLMAFAVHAATAPLVSGRTVSTSKFLRWTEERLQQIGPGAFTGLPSAALLFGGIGGLVAPGLASLAVARFAEGVCRDGWFRSAYERLYTPISPSEKRAAKSFIDVGVHRLGEALGGGVIQLVLVLQLSGSRDAVILWMAVGSSCLALLVASRLTGGYVATLQRNLINDGRMPKVSEQDSFTKTMIHKTLSSRKTGHYRPDVTGLGELQSGDPERVAAFLRRTSIPTTLVPHVIRLLAWEPVAEDAVFALRQGAEERVGQFTDALLDRNQPWAARSRLARVFSVCVSQRAIDGLILGLEDKHFKVRFQCGRSLMAIARRNPRVLVESVRIYPVVLRELDIERVTWESRRLLDHSEGRGEHTIESELAGTLASEGLAHVFNLLALVLPAEPVRHAYRGLLTTDENVRGNALQYLERTLPPLVRTRLWPFLENNR